jgi:hypothetical protein
MSKPIIIAAVCALFFTAAPAFAQDAPCPAPGFNGPHGSATNLRDTPSSDPTAAAPGRRPGFEGPHGSASNLRDTPSSDPTATHIRRATLHVRKAGADNDAAPARSCRRTDGDGTNAGFIPREIRSSGVLKPLAAVGDDGATGGLTKVGGGTLRATEPGAPREHAPRM